MYKSLTFVNNKKVKNLRDCADLCYTCGEFCARDSQFMGALAKACANTCIACADLCDTRDFEVAKECAEACRRCADACREVA